MPEHYLYQVSYSKTTSDCEYRFITKHNLRYLVYFIDVTRIIDVLDDYPVLSTGMFLGIELLSDEYSLVLFDADIGVTIASIIKDYIRYYGKNLIIIYNCDEKDGKQQKRNLKFKRWFDLYADSTDFISFHQTLLEEENDGTLTNHFISILYSEKHSRLPFIEKEIQSLQIWLTGDKG